MAGGRGCRARSDNGILPEDLIPPLKSEDRPAPFSGLLGRLIEIIAKTDLAEPSGCTVKVNSLLPGVGEEGPKRDRESIVGTVLLFFCTRD